VNTNQTLCEIFPRATYALQFSNTLTLSVSNRRSGRRPGRFRAETPQTFILAVLWVSGWIFLASPAEPRIAPFPPPKSPRRAPVYWSCSGPKLTRKLRKKICKAIIHFDF
jgi:hypothetical protein